MVKKITLIVMMFLAVSSFSYAEVYLSDDADIFTEDTRIEAELEKLSDELGYPVFLVTTEKQYTKSPEDATDDMLYARGIEKGEDALIISINMMSRDIYFMPTGDNLVNSSKSDAQFDSISESVREELSKDCYDNAAYTYISKTRDVLGENYLSLKDIAIAAGASLLGVGGYGAAEMRKYNPKPKRKNFALYENSIVDINTAGDLLINTRQYVSIIPKSESSSGSGRSTSMTSSGRSHRGGGSKF